MNLKQALKRKNRLIGQITEEFKKLTQYNSIDEGNIRPYSARESMKNWMSLTDDLITLKCDIQIANQPANEKIFRIAEVKTQAKLLRELICTDGTYYFSSKWGDEKPIPKSKNAEIGVLERDELVKNLESQIETLQDEIDQFNHETLIK